MNHFDSLDRRLDPPDWLPGEEAEFERVARERAEDEVRENAPAWKQWSDDQLCNGANDYERWTAACMSYCVARSEDNSCAVRDTWQALTERYVWERRQQPAFNDLVAEDVRLMRETADEV